MSLYTFSRYDHLPALPPIDGLHIEESTDVSLLSQMGDVVPAEVVKRLANHHLAFVAFIHGQPAAFGWMARGEARIGELNHDLVMPLQNRYLWNFRTMIAFRGLGIYPALLQFIIQYESERARRFWIIHAPENKASLQGILKAGFRYTGKLYATANGQAKFEAATLSDEEHGLVTAMDFHPSDEPSATCWNCSSPYMKKRTETCCCTAAGQSCSVLHYQVA